MTGAGGLGGSRNHGGDRFYNPSGIRRDGRVLQRQQQYLLQLRRAGNRDESDDSVPTLSQPPTIDSFLPPPLPPTNLDRILVAVTPFVTARCFPKVKAKECWTREAERHPSYCLGDLWESFSEWSSYGLGVPLVLNGDYIVKQFYVPSLSGIQLYVDASNPHLWLRMPGEESAAESSRRTQSGQSSDCEVDKQPEASVTNSSSAEAESCTSLGKLLFEYLEKEQPHNREPLTNKMSVLATQFPELKILRSCDLLPASWISVAWYPIYRIPVGPTLRDLDASFLTFHCLSTHSKCSVQPFHAAAGLKVPGCVDASIRMSLPVFGFASYKLRGSILIPSGPHELERQNSLLQAAESWLQHLHVHLPDYQFFRAHYSTQRR